MCLRWDTLSSFLPKCAMRAENGTAANRALDGGTHRGATQTSTRTTRPRTHAPRMPHAAPPHFPVSPLCTPRRALSGSRHPVSSISFFLLPVATLRHRSVLSRQPQAIRRRRPGHGGPSCGSSCEDAKGMGHSMATYVSTRVSYSIQFVINLSFPFGTPIPQYLPLVKFSRKILRSTGFERTTLCLSARALTVRSVSAENREVYISLYIAFFFMTIGFR